MLSQTRRFLRGARAAAPERKGTDAPSASRAHHAPKAGRPVGQSGGCDAWAGPMQGDPACREAQPRGSPEAQDLPVCRGCVPCAPGDLWRDCTPALRPLAPAQGARAARSWEARAVPPARLTLLSTAPDALSAPPLLTPRGAEAGTRAPASPQPCRRGGAQPRDRPSPGVVPSAACVRADSATCLGATRSGDTSQAPRGKAAPLLRSEAAEHSVPLGFRRVRSVSASERNVHRKDNGADLGPEGAAGEGGASCPQAGPTDGRSRARLPAQRPPGGATAGRSPWALATPNLLATGGSGARRERLVGSPEPRTASVSAAPRPVTGGRSGGAPRRGPLPAPPGDRRRPRPGARTPA